MTPVQIPSFMYIGTTVIELRVFNKKKKKKCIEHGQNVKIHFSITVDTSGIFIEYLVYTFVSTCFVKNAKSQIHLKLKVKTDIPLCIAE